MIMKTNPDLVLMDVIMPKLDGISVMERVKKERYGKRIPSFIMVTAAGNDNVAADAFQLGASYYIMKPFNREVVMDKIRRVCRGSAKLSSNEEMKRVSPCLLYTSPCIEASGDSGYLCKKPDQPNQRRNIRTVPPV